MPRWPPLLLAGLLVTATAPSPPVAADVSGGCGVAGRTRSRVNAELGDEQCRAGASPRGSADDDGGSLVDALDAFDLVACEAEDAKWLQQRGEGEQHFLPRAWGLEDRRPGKGATEGAAQLLAEEVKHADRLTAFRAIYSGDVWGGGAGPGSRLRITSGVRCALEALRAAVGFTSLWDVSGDFQWMRAWLEKHPEIRYEGADIVPEIAGRLSSRFSRQGQSGRASWSFVSADIVCGANPLHQASGFDVVLLREVLQHLTPPEILEALRCVSASGAGWLLATDFPGLRLVRGQHSWHLRDANLDLESGVDHLDKWRWHAYDLMQPPYSLPEPLRRFPDDGKTLALWKLPLALV